MNKIRLLPVAGKKFNFPEETYDLSKAEAIGESQAFERVCRRLGLLPPEGFLMAMTMAGKDGQVCHVKGATMLSYFTLRVAMLPGKGATEEQVKSLAGLLGDIRRLIYEKTRIQFCVAV